MNKRYEITRENLELIKSLNGFFLRKITDEKITEILGKLPNMIEREKNNIQCEINHLIFTRWCQFYGLTAINICQKTDIDLNKFLDRELAAKRQNLITRITKKAGNIIDATGLYIGSTGEINGVIVGDIKTVTVQTISAGGYAVQCYHFRVLVK